MQDIFKYPLLIGACLLSASIGFACFKKIFIFRTAGNLAEQQYRSAISQINDIILMIRACDKSVLDANPAFSLLLGYGPEEIHGLTLFDILVDSPSETNWTVTQIIDENRCCLGERKFRCRNGTSLAVDLNASVVSCAGTQVICMIARDISERKRHEGELLHMANHDPLTGLPNRTLFLDRLHQAIYKQERTGKMIAVMFMDLDQFKMINDTYGHIVGDQLLKEVAGRLQGFIRKSDTIARQGGDEFTLIIDGIAAPRDCVHVAQKALDIFAEPFHFEAGRVFATASIGITFYPTDSTTADGLLKNADTAMYHAKESGRNNYQFFSRELNEKVCRRLALEFGLRQALDRKELVLHYQPRVEAKTGKVLGVEALLRWNHPELGLVQPLTFIPLAEETGLTVPIGEWVLRTSCAQNKAWQDAGLPAFKISVNVSCRQFKQHNLAAAVGRVLQETGLKPGYLELEITESILMTDPDYAINVLNELKGLGVSISLDDFGTGYSSLLQLKQLPIDFLKVDRNFIAGINRNRNDETLLTIIIQMGHSLGIKVIAEGVETSEQIAYLLARECSEMQGFYFSKPLPAAAMKHYLEKNSMRGTVLQVCSNST